MVKVHTMQLPQLKTQFHGKASYPFDALSGPTQRSQGQVK